MKRWTFVASAAVATLLAALAPAIPAQSKPSGASRSDVRDVGSDYLGGRVLPIESTRSSRFAPRAVASRKVGSTHDWLAVDDAQQVYYTKRFTLRAVGKHAEVWVASDRDTISSRLGFPRGDCRNDERIKVSDRQVHYLLDQFDHNIYPTEAQVFSVAPPRDGSEAILPSLITDNQGRQVYPQGYWRGGARKTVVLIDNVRDSNFYDVNGASNNTYIAGFFSSALNELLDRNVMTIDGFDWIHRTHRHPPNEPGNNTCTNKVARPFQYESVFAHEYQHLLEYYQDPTENVWVNEGLSDWTMDLAGYANPKTPITKLGFDNHIWTFLGYSGIVTPANPVPRFGGPENSLTWWEDQGDGRILDDYGAAWTMMEFLAGRYGTDFMGQLHRNKAQGLQGLQSVLDQSGASTSSRAVIHDWAAALALDAVLDDGAQLTGGQASTYQMPTMNGSINWDTTGAYARAGAPPNGSDYVRLRDANGNYLNASAITSIDFDGAETLPPTPVEWTIDTAPPGRASSALYSGGDLNVDRSIIRKVSVPNGNNATLDFNTRYDIEDGWDFGFVQVSTDGGSTWTSLSNAHTTGSAQARSIQVIRDNVPGFTGRSGCPAGSQTADSCSPTWVPESFDLSHYAGQDVLLAFRYISDPAFAFDGWWIDDVRVGNQTISDGSSLGGWQSPTEVHPIPIEGFTVQLVAYDDAHDAAWVKTLPLGSGFTGTLTGADLRSAIGDSAQTVAAIVTYDDSSEASEAYAPYVLKVNGVTQPGGS